MKKANFSLKDFRSRVESQGLAKPTRFEVNIPCPTALRTVFGRPEMETIDLFCEAASLPPQIVGVKAQRLYGPTIYKPFGVEFGGEGIPLTFYADRRMNVKAFFDAWVSKIVDPFQFFVYYRDEYAVDMRISQLDEQNNVTYTAKIIDCFPRSVTLMELNSGNQNQVHKINVNFAYKRWIPEDHSLLARMPYPLVTNL